MRCHSNNWTQKQFTKRAIKEIKFILSSEIPRLLVYLRTLPEQSPGFYHSQKWNECQSIKITKKQLFLLWLQLESEVLLKGEPAFFVTSGVDHRCLQNVWCNKSWITCTCTVSNGFKKVNYFGKLGTNGEHWTLQNLNDWMRSEWFNETEFLTEPRMFCTHKIWFEQWLRSRRKTISKDNCENSFFSS